MSNLTETEHTILAEVRHHARSLTETTSALYWDTPFEAVLIRRLWDDMAKIAALYSTPEVTSILARSAPRTRYSWDGHTTTAHVETV
jgi:hypothetical protein